MACGGGSNSPSGSNSPGGPPQFTIRSGDWVIPVAGGASAGGTLTQTGHNISGVLHVIGSSCFDPVADALTVTGSVSSDLTAINALTLSTTPIRGQMLSLSATWVAQKAPTAPPPNTPDNPTSFLAGASTLTGGACAGTASGGGSNFVDFSGKWLGNAGAVTVVMSQTGPDSQGFFHVSGTLSDPGGTCFTSGTIASSTIAGEMNHVTFNTDTGQLVGSANRIITAIVDPGNPFATNAVSFSLTVKEGPCDTQNISILMSPG